MVTPRLLNVEKTRNSVDNVYSLDPTIRDK